MEGSLPHYKHAPPTQTQLDYAELPTIDLASPPTEVVIQTVKHAMADHGFFYVINHGKTQSEVEHIFDIANLPFANVSDEEKRQYEATMKTTGSYQGYKLRQYWHVDGGVRDQIETYNINRDVTQRGHPQVLRPYLPELAEFARHNHVDILHPILRLLARGLALPEETFVDLHNFEGAGETYLRFMK